MNNKVEQWALAKFEGLSRLELREAGTTLGATFAPNQSEKKMREKLNQIVGQTYDPRPEDSDEAPVVIAQALEVKKKQGRPRLNATDKWEGRRHRVTVHRGQDASDHKCFVITWDSYPRSFEYGKQIDMPEPYYNIMSTSTMKDVKQRKVFLDEERSQYKMESYDVPRPRFAYNYDCITPGTEVLPGSLLEYWQGKAERNNFFTDLATKGLDGRRILMQIYADVVEPRGPDFYKDMTNEDILSEILRRIGAEDRVYDDADSMLV